MAIVSSSRRSAVTASRLLALEALGLRRAGISWPEAADRLSEDEGRLRAAVFEYLAEGTTSSAAERLEARALVAERLDLALQPVLEQAASGNLKAVDRLLAIHKQQLELSELPRVRPEGRPDASVADSLQTLVQRVASQAASADLNDASLPQLLVALGPLLDRLNAQKEQPDVLDATESDRLRRIAHLLDSARARGAGAPASGEADDGLHGVQEEDDAGL